MSNKEEKKPAPKKDEFTNYLEKSGVVDNLSDVLIHLYEESERPKFPTEYIKSNLKSSSTDDRREQHVKRRKQTITAESERT